MLGHRLDDKGQKQALREADPASTGSLEFEQFAVYASRYVEVEEDMEAIAKELREAFLLYDREGHLLFLLLLLLLLLLWSITSCKY